MNKSKENWFTGSFRTRLTSVFLLSEAVGGCLGELGPVDLSTIALHHGKDPIYTQAASLYPDVVHQWVSIILSCMNNALTDQR